MNELRRYLNEERGRGSDLARALGVTPGAVTQWAATQVPAQQILKVSEITKIPVNVLRPDMLPANGEAA